jgi:hypothetical protein
MEIYMFAILDKAKPNAENTSGRNLAVVDRVTIQESCNLKYSWWDIICCTKPGLEEV